MVKPDEFATQDIEAIDLDIIPPHSLHHAFGRDLILRLCGGTFPEINGFDWSLVDQFRVFNGKIIPFCNGVAIGPDLRIIVSNDGGTSLFRK